MTWSPRPRRNPANSPSRHRAWVASGTKWAPSSLTPPESSCVSSPIKAENRRPSQVCRARWIIAGGGVHEHVEFLRAGKLRNLMHTGPKDLDIPDYGKAYTIVNYIPALKALSPMGGTYSIAVRRQTPVEVLNKIKPVVDRGFQVRSLRENCEAQILPERHPRGRGRGSPGRATREPERHYPVEAAEAHWQKGARTQGTRIARPEGFRCLVAAQGIQAPHELGGLSRNACPERAARKMRRPVREAVFLYSVSMPRELHGFFERR